MVNTVGMTDANGVERAAAAGKLRYGECASELGRTENLSR